MIITLFTKYSGKIVKVEAKSVDKKRCTWLKLFGACDSNLWAC